MGATTYVAFLRAINVSNRIVKMSELKRIFESVGLEDVSTFIASGNVVFRSPAAAPRLVSRIEAALEQTLGYPVATMLRSAGDVAAVAAHRPPFGAGDESSAPLHVGFCRGPAAPANVQRALALATDVDLLHVHGREVYWLARNRLSKATISMAAVEKALGTPVTFRNINTVRRLAERLNGKW